MSRLCDDCSVSNPDEAKHCGNCGNFLKPEEPRPPRAMVHCGACGKLQAAAHKYCIKCGSAIR